MISRLPIKVSAPLLVGVPVLLVGIGLLVRWNLQSRAAVREVADQNIQQIHDMVSTKVIDLLRCPAGLPAQPRSAADREAGSGRSAVLEKDVHRRVDGLRHAEFHHLGGRGRPACWFARYSQGNYYWALKNDPAGDTMSEWRVDDQGGMATEPSSTFEFDLHTRPWYAVPREAGVPTWTEPYVWVGAEDSEVNTLGISYGIPMYRDDGSLWGVVDADFTLDDLGDYLQSIAIGRSGVAVLATDDGRMVATSTGHSVVGGDRSRCWPPTPNPMIKATAGSSARGYPPSMRARHRHRGRELLPAGLAHRTRPTDWTLATVVPERDFVANIDREFKRSIASSIAVILAVRACWPPAGWGAAVAGLRRPPDRSG